MKTSELIAELQKLQALHGDLPVTIAVGYHSSGESFMEVDDASKVDAWEDPDSDRHFKTDHVHLNYRL